MKAVVILAHPNPLSFNASIAKAVQEELEKKGAEVKCKNLYDMGWNPILSAQDFQGYHTDQISPDIQKEQQDIAWADVVIMIAPVWWYSVPAILKGYIDRVFSIGFAYKYTPQGPQGLLTGKKGLVITTSGADETAVEMIKAVRLSAVEALFGFCGFDSYEYRNLFAVTVVSDEERKSMLTDVRQLIQNFV